MMSMALDSPATSTARPPVAITFALMAVGGDIGCSLGPWLSGLTTDLVIAHTSPETLASLGLTAQQLGLRSGMLAGVFFTLLLIAGLLISKRMKTDSEKA